jgi:hypothetical protein
MLFHVTWEFIDTSEDGIRRSLEVFSKWQPPARAEFKASTASRTVAGVWR